VFIRFWGEICTNDLHKTFKALIEKDQAAEGYHWICDVTKGKRLFEIKQVEAFANVFKMHSDKFVHSKVAIVIANRKQSQTVDALVNYFDVNQIKIQVKKVLDTKEALHWMQNN
jgi:hypothetical protein